MVLMTVLIAATAFAFPEIELSNVGRINRACARPAKATAAHATNTASRAGRQNRYDGTVISPHSHWRQVRLSPGTVNRCRVSIRHARIRLDYLQIRFTTLPHFS